MKKLILLFSFLYSSVFFGQNIWEPIVIPDTIEAGAINAEKEGVLLISAKGDNGFGGLLRSFDDGINWESLETGLPYYIPIHRIKYTPNGNLLLGMSCCILRSEDDGDTFEQVSQTGGNILNFNISPVNEIYAVGWNTILRSLNDGVTWDTVVFTNSNIYFSDIDFGLNGELYTVGGSFDGPGTGSGFQRSFDYGNTWENIGLTDSHINFIEVNNEGEIIVGGGETAIFSSNDLGDSWTQLSNMLLTALESNIQDNLIAGVDGYDYNGCRFSEDWGINWQNVNDSVLNPYINQISYTPSNTVYIQSKKLSSYDFQLYKSINPLLSIKYNRPTSDVKLFPNPTRNKIIISTKNEEEILTYDIYNTNGQKIQSGNYLNNEIDVSKLNSGFYIIEIEFENKSVRKSIIIE